MNGSFWYGIFGEGKVGRRRGEAKRTLVLAQHRQVKQDRERGGVGRQDNEFARAPVQGLCCLVGCTEVSVLWSKLLGGEVFLRTSFLELAVVRRLLDEIDCPAVSWGVDGGE